jgi:Helicase conserved C-terminal domain
MLAMKSLGAIIRARNLNDLQMIATMWGVSPLSSDDTNEILSLERQMRDPVTTRTLWEQLSADERIVLLAIVGPSARNWCPIDQLPERSGVSEEVAKSALDQLCGRYLVEREIARMQGNELHGQRSPFYSYVTSRSQQEPIIEREIAYVPTELATTLYSIGREYNGIPADRTTLSLDDLLMPYRQGDLDQIGKRFNLTLQSYSSRNEVRSVIAQNVCQANAVQYVLDHLDAPLRQIFNWLLDHNGQATHEGIRKQMRWSITEMIQAIHSLEEHAIVFDGFSQCERVLFIPKATYDNLKRANSRQPTEVGLRKRPTPRSIRPADSIILWDIAALVALVSQQEVELTRTHGLPKRTAQRLANILSNDTVLYNDEWISRYITQLQYEASDLGIVRITKSEDHPRLEPGDKLDTWAHHDSRMQTLRILRRWLHNRMWQDRVGSNYRGWMSMYLNISSAREALVQALHQCDPGVWYDVTSLLRTIQGDDPFILRPQQRFNGQGGFKMTDEVRAHWNGTDGELLRGILSSTLFDLGVVSLGYDTPSLPADRLSISPDAFMLTELGAEVLKDDLGLAHIPNERAMIVQPNFEILLLEPHMPALYQLIRFTQVEQLGRASRFKLTRESLLRAISDGMMIDEIITFLNEHSQKDLAQNVIYTLHDWSRQYKETRISQVVLIEVEDEILATELCSSAKLRDLGLRRIGPQALAAPQGKALRTVRRAIERAGYATHGCEPEKLATRG